MVVQQNWALLRERVWDRLEPHAAEKEAAAA